MELISSVLIFLGFIMAAFAGILLFKNRLSLSAGKKTPQKKSWRLLLVGILLFVLGGMLSPEQEAAQQEEVASTSTTAEDEDVEAQEDLETGGYKDDEVDAKEVKEKKANNDAALSKEFSDEMRVYHEGNSGLDVFEKVIIDTDAGVIIVHSLVPDMVEKEEKQHYTQKLGNMVTNMYFTDYRDRFKLKEVEIHNIDNEPIGYKYNDARLNN